jgi:hypothetical protein
MEALEHILVCPAGTRSIGCKSRNPPGSGKDIAKGKGVHREVESEGSRMANLWSDEQKSHQARHEGKAAEQVEAQ